MKIARLIDFQFGAGSKANIDATYAAICYNRSPEPILSAQLILTAVRERPNGRTTWERIVHDIGVLPNGYGELIGVYTTPGELLWAQVNFTDIRGTPVARSGGELVIELEPDLPADRWQGPDLDMEYKPSKKIRIVDKKFKIDEE